MDAKFYAATQVIDEARHVEAYSRLLHDKFELVVSDQPAPEAAARRHARRLALGLDLSRHAGADRRAWRSPRSALIRDQATEPARRRRSTPTSCRTRRATSRSAASRSATTTRSSPQKERDEREEFAVEACYLMRDRFLAEEVWETLGLPVEECAALHRLAPRFMQLYRSRLFSRIVPTIKDIGLWGPRIQKAYADMGILGFADADVDALGERDEEIALDFDRRRQEVEQVAALAATAVIDVARRSAPRRGATRCGAASGAARRRAGPAPERAVEGAAARSSRRGTRSRSGRSCRRRGSGGRGRGGRRRPGA